MKRLQVKTSLNLDYAFFNNTHTWFNRVISSATSESVFVH